MSNRSGFCAPPPRARTRQPSGADLEERPAVAKALNQSAMSAANEPQLEHDQGLPVRSCRLCGRRVPKSIRGTRRGALHTCPWTPRDPRGPALGPMSWYSKPSLALFGHCRLEREEVRIRRSVLVVECAPARSAHASRSSSRPAPRSRGLQVGRAVCAPSRRLRADKCLQVLPSASPRSSWHPQRSTEPR